MSASFVTTAFRSEAERRNIEAPGMNMGRVGMVAFSISVITEAICGIAFARSRQQLGGATSEKSRRVRRYLLDCHRWRGTGTGIPGDDAGRDRGEAVSCILAASAVPNYSVLHHGISGRGLGLGGRDIAKMSWNGASREPTREIPVDKVGADHVERPENHLT